MQSLSQGIINKVILDVVTAVAIAAARLFVAAAARRPRVFVFPCLLPGGNWRHAVHHGPTV
jgi:hypothetical protein